MLEVKDIQIMVKDNYIYFKYEGVDYICRTEDFYANLRLFLASDKVEPFDTFLIKKASKRTY